MDRIFRKVERGVEALFGEERHAHTHSGHSCEEHHSDAHTGNRFQSFAAQTTGNAKWYVDGCSYFWAVSEAIEQARESIYILDWWLSPELYLRRPPSANERYRLDNLLKAAAERGVKVNIIVYKEVEAALTLKSSHTRTYLESLHPNIGVFRHPDHVPTGYDLNSEIGENFSNLSLSTFKLSTFSGDALKTIYGTATDGVVLFWAHHEKLCLIDNRIAFMGGLDMCFGRWDTNSHPIADAHPGNLDAIVFPGQDYNNARVYDFADVDNWEQNKLDRTKSSRMGWSDVAISLSGPIVQSLSEHFVDRWNFIFDDKYTKKNPGKYGRIDGFSQESGRIAEDGQGGGFFGGAGHQAGHLFGDLGDRINRGMSHLMVSDDQPENDGRPLRQDRGDQSANIQLTRSCTKWSSGHPTEHSIANAYIDAITRAQHFVYMENQFFITATSDKQHPVTNKIGRAIVDRILRAHRNGEDFKVIVNMPAVPAFAGDLKADDALGTRAIMEFQYNSISRGGHSIIESLRNEGGIDDPGRYIRFYNLRNYDRINVSSDMSRAERESGVSYEDARREHDDAVGAGYEPRGEGTGASWGGRNTQYDRYQQAASRVGDHTWDTVSSCYMDAGPDLHSVPWQGEPEAEMDAFVSEELYIHSKLLIADDNLVIVGSANLNDRSQLGTHDSEIAVIIEDPTPVESEMAGRPYTASKFAASLRRQIFRKHLGLLPDQRWDRPDDNWTSVERGPNVYDWGSPADRLVQDPMSREFWNLWEGTARTNTEVFSKVFHNVPNDHVRTWKDYDEFFSRHFIIPGAKKEGDGEGEGDNAGKVEYGHVVKEEFPGGVGEVKDWLNRVRGNIVEMPLDFLVDVDDIAKEGLSLNSFTDELYT
ncbi:Phospholipase D1 [Colletotrichum aenigma]|uniref:Phospholipase D1 n=1 Tax=Colletotrichum aenigma TaxID=1215731 RepID=UPI0018733D44|nr:Phospholipase D1 [Colletotrichum aenigma]KAF5520832.1 Phospholipase D1 [Colletotrichum aenigma]